LQGGRQQSDPMQQSNKHANAKKSVEYPWHYIMPAPWKELSQTVLEHRTKLSWMFTVIITNISKHMTIHVEKLPFITQFYITGLIKIAIF
jgi:hypothetical protein